MPRWTYWPIAIGGVLLLLALFNLSSEPEPANLHPEMSYSAFLDEVAKDAIDRVTLNGNHIAGYDKTGKAFATTIARIDQTVDLLLARKVAVTVRSAEDLPSLSGVVASWLPFILYMLAFWWFVGRPLTRIEQRLHELEKAIPSAPQADWGWRVSAPVIPAETGFGSSEPR